MCAWQGTVAVTADARTQLLSFTCTTRYVYFCEVSGSGDSGYTNSLGKCFQSEIWRLAGGRLLVQWDGGTDSELPDALILTSHADEDHGLGAKDLKLAKAWGDFPLVVADAQVFLQANSSYDPEELVGLPRCTKLSNLTEKFHHTDSSF